jgi:hypothetical protein
MKVSNREVAEGAKVALVRAVEARRDARAEKGQPGAQLSESYAIALRMLNPANESDARLILSMYAREAREAMGTQD